MSASQIIASGYPIGSGFPGGRSVSPIKVIGSSSPVKRAPTVENYNRVFDENLNKKAAAPSGKNKILEWVIFLLPVILAILCIVAAAFLINENIKDTKDVHSAQRILARVNTNLNTQPITELEQVEEATPCRQGFSELVLGSWEGVKSGCLCENDKEKHHRAYCVFHSSCKFVKEKDPIEEKVWYGREGIFLEKTTKFCAKRTSSFTHKNKDGGCPANHKTCRDVCVPQESHCPLNRAQPSTLDVVRTNLVQVTGKKILFESSSTEPDGNSFINLRISSSKDGKCYDPKTAPKFASGKFYPYQRGREEGCRKEEIQTGNYQELDIGVEAQIFKINKVEPIIKELPFQTDFYNPQDNFYLLAERRITVNHIEACQSVNINQSEQMEEYARSTTNILHGLAITILVLSGVIVLIAIIFIALKNHPKLQEKNNPVKVIYIIGFILLIICVVLAIVYLCKKDKLEETSAIYKKYVDKECFNEAPIKNACKTISSYAADVESRFAKYALIFFISSLVLMLVGFLLAVWRKGSQGEKQLFEKPWE